MLLLPSAIKIFLSAAPVDLRKSIDGPAALVQTRGHDPYSGHLFVFQSRRGTLIKILVWDHSGFVLEQGRFRMPTIAENATEVRLDATQLAMLLDGIDVKRVATPKRWTPPSKKLDGIS